MSIYVAQLRCTQVKDFSPRIPDAVLRTDARQLISLALGTPVSRLAWLIQPYVLGLRLRGRSAAPRAGAPVRKYGRLAFTSDYRWKRPCVTYL